MPQAKADNTEEWLKCYDQALADIRVSGAIAHASSLALLGNEAYVQEALGNALAYAYEAAQRAADLLLTMDSLRNAPGGIRGAGERQ